jgi:hypothetical protein
VIVGEPDEILLDLLYVEDDLDPAAPGRGKGGR